MITTKEILNRLTTEISSDFNSRGTLAAEELYYKLFDELNKTLDV